MAITLSVYSVYSVHSETRVFLNISGTPGATDMPRPNLETSWPQLQVGPPIRGRVGQAHQLDTPILTLTSVVDNILPVGSETKCFLNKVVNFDSTHMLCTILESPELGLSKNVLCLLFCPV